MAEAVRARLGCPHFLACHRTESQHFTRRRELTFTRVVLLVLQKGVKSLQGRLGEFSLRLEALAQGQPPFAVTPAAWTQARAKLAHTAFIALNQQAVLASFYEDPAGREAVRRWQGHRLCAVDGSLLFLPENEALGAHFGWTGTGNERGPSAVRHVQARASVYFDLLNGLGLDARLEPVRAGERVLGALHGPAVQPGDVVVTDRGYCGQGWFAHVRARGADFVCRVPRRWRREAAALFAANQAGESVRVALGADKKRPGAPPELGVRLVSLRLATGELEVLATSLLDEARYPTASFGPLYAARWGIETYYARLKGHLELERWSGQTLEAVRQDFFSSVFLANVESLLHAPAQAQLQAGDPQRKHPAQVNRAQSLRVLKAHALELFSSALPPEALLHQLTQLMRASPQAQRRGRPVARLPPCPRRSLWHLRYRRRHTF